jgi:hypothetical protein
MPVASVCIMEMRCDFGVLSAPSEQAQRGTAQMRRGEFGWHEDHLTKNLAIALALAVIGASVVDSLVGAAIPYTPTEDSLKLTCAEAKADMAEIDGATLGRPTTMLNPISTATADGEGCHLKKPPSTPLKVHLSRASTPP